MKKNIFDSLMMIINSYNGKRELIYLVNVRDPMLIDLHRLII